jgi:hypothetical protein
MEKHVNILAIIYIVYAIMGLIGASVILIIFVGSGLITGLHAGEEDAALFVAVFGLIIGGIVLLTSIPSLIAGIGLLRYKSWARILAAILAILNLPVIPIGTGIGIYGLWILFNDETIRLFDRGKQPVRQPQT